MADAVVKEWTRLLGSSSYDGASGISTAADGSIYITGFTYGSLDGQTNNGGGDVFISKYSSDGTRAWTRLLGSSAKDWAGGISTAVDGSIYITGSTAGSLDGQRHSGGTNAFTSDAFISKYSSDGTRAWTRLLGSSAEDWASGISTAADGSIYIAGETYGSLDGQTNRGASDAFISKYSSDGTKAWTRLLGSSGGSARGISTAADGSIYITGSTYGYLDGETYSDSGSTGAYIIRYNSDGTKAWTRPLGSSSAYGPYGISTAADGSIYISGYTNGSLDGQRYSGGTDAFISKYSSDGTRAWTRLLGSSTNDEARGISTAADGSIYITGFTKGSLDGQTNSGYFDAFISKYSSDGTKAWTRLLGTSSSDEALGISTAADGSIYITGYTEGSLDGQTHSGLRDAFIRKFGFDNVISPGGSSSNSSGSGTAIKQTTDTVDSLSRTNKTKDIFSFGAAPGYGNQKDSITNFSTKDKDVLQFSKTAFGVSKGKFAIARKAKALTKVLATDANFVYNQQKGELIFNANGPEAGFGVDGGVFALLVGAPKLTSASVSFV